MGRWTYSFIERDNMKDFVRAAYIRNLFDSAKLMFDGQNLYVSYYRPNGTKNASIIYDTTLERTAWVEYFDDNGANVQCQLK
jgi:hypothetical protein